MGNQACSSISRSGKSDDAIIKQLQDQNLKLEEDLNQLHSVRLATTGRYSTLVQLNKEKAALENEIAKSAAAQQDAQRAEEIKKLLQDKEKEILSVSTETVDALKRQLDEANRKIALLQTERKEITSFAEKAISLKAAPAAEKDGKSQQELADAFTKIKDKKGGWLENPLGAGIEGEVATLIAENFSLKLKIVKASNLPAPLDRSPFCTVTVIDQVRKTRVIPNTCNPEWNEDLTFMLEVPPLEARIDVWDFDEASGETREVLGSYSVNLKPFYSIHAAPTVSDTVQLHSPDDTVATLSFTLEFRVIPVTVQRWTGGYTYDAIAKLLRFAAVDPNATDNKGRTALMESSIKNQPHAVKSLLLAKADANEHNKLELDMTALMYATMCGHADVVEVLLSDGRASVHQTDQLQRSALAYAARRNRVNIATTLVEAKASVDAPDAEGLTPLLHAALEGCVDMVTFLLNRKANVNAVNQMKWTALMFATVHRHDNCMEELIRYNADVDIADSNGMTPLMVSAVRGRTDSVSVLLEAKANVNAQDTRSRTALIYAAFQGHMDVVSSLTQAKADAFIQDKDGNTATMIAAQQNHPDVAHFLSQLQLKQEPAPPS